MDDFIPPRFDPAFKKVFADAADLGPLRSLICAVLGMNDSALASLTLVDPQLHRLRRDDKECVLDALVETDSGDYIDVEIQLTNEGNIPQRLLYYASRLLASRLTRGRDYAEVKRAICIAITGFTLISDPDYHHRFQMFDHVHKTHLSDVLQIDLLELPKVPVDDATRLGNWLRFLRADTREELMMISQADPAIAKAALKADDYNEDQVAWYRQLRADMAEYDRLNRMQQELKYEQRQQAIAEELARRRAEAMAEGQPEELAESEVQGLIEGDRRARIDIARRLLARGFALDTIEELTHLSLVDVDMIAG